jgi:multimeric flavodoxin WrbA
MSSDTGTVPTLPPAEGTAAGGRSFLFLLGSSRQGGNTEQLARAAVAGFGDGAVQVWLRLSEHPLPPFVDLRHNGDGRYPAPDGEAAVLLAATLAATDLVIASPLYWYNLSAATKLYLDHWTGWMRVPGVDFRERMGDKTLWAVTAYSSDHEGFAEPLVSALRLSAEYFGMRWGGALLARANRPGPLKPQALERAATFFHAEAPSPGDVG